MKKLTLLVLTLSLPGLFVACKEKQAVADEENVIHVQIGTTPETIDPAMNSTVDGSNMIIHAFEGLLKFNEKMKLFPDVRKNGNNQKTALHGLSTSEKVSKGLTERSSQQKISSIHGNA